MGKAHAPASIGAPRYSCDSLALVDCLKVTARSCRNVITVMTLASPFSSTSDQRAELEGHLRRRNLPARVARRMRIILLLADGASYSQIQRKLDTAATTISRWKTRYEEAGLEGLATFHPGQPPRLLSAELRAKILTKTKEDPPDGSTHWSLRKMAKVLKVGKDLVRQVWKEVDLRPHRLDRYKASDDPNFEAKAAEIIGLYLNPPQHAAVFCVDEKTAIQALDRTDRRLPLSPGRPSAMALNTFAISRYRFTRPSTPKQAMSLARLLTATPAPSLFLFSAMWLPVGQQARRSTSFWIICRRIKPARFASSWRQSSGPVPLYSDLLFLAQPS